MGNGLFNSPPSLPGDTFQDVPVTDFVEQAKATTKGQQESHWYDWFWHAFWKSTKEGIGLFISLFVGGLDDVMAQALSFVSAAQGTGQPGMLALMAAVMEDLLAIPVEGDELIASFQKGGRLGAMRKAGGKLFDILAAEMAPAGGAVSIQPSREPAGAFLGFLIEFAVREGNLAVISELLPEDFNFMGGLREYGELLAKNLGLGRLARLALRPLITTLVADPLQWSLNDLYRPTLLTAQQALRLFVEGQIDGATLTTNLHNHGYDDKYHLGLISNAYTKRSPDDLYEYFKATGGDLTPPISAIQLLGYDPSTAGQVWEATRQSRVDPLWHTYIHELLTQFRGGYLDSVSLQNALSAVPLTSDELGVWQRIFAQAAAVPHKQLTESELENAFLQGIIDLSQLQAAWAQRGFSADSIQVLTALVLIKLKGGTKTKAGHAPHKSLTDAQLEKALKDGLMTLAEVEVYLAGIGYSATDVKVLTALFAAPTAASTPPAATPPATP